MPAEKEQHERPADQSPDNGGSTDTLSLVDYFDQMDRDAFRRSLEYRDGNRDRRTTD